MTDAQQAMAAKSELSHCGRRRCSNGGRQSPRGLTSKSNLVLASVAWCRWSCAPCVRGRHHKELLRQPKQNAAASSGTHHGQSR
jgi:hypothetical protein